jgi:hypothetical protein
MGLSLALFAGASRAEDGKPGRDFNARLSGAQEVPAVTTTAVTGKTTVKFGKALDNVKVGILMDTPATPITGAHLHCAAAGVNGNIVLNLLAPAGGAPPVAFQTLVLKQVLSATYTNTALTPNAVATTTCPVVINNIASLLHAIRTGLIYANVHTTASPNGEVRAQIFSQR